MKEEHFDEIIKLDHHQFEQFQKTLEAGFAGIQKWQSIQNDSIQQGFDKVADKLTKPELPKELAKIDFEWHL